MISRQFNVLARARLVAAAKSGGERVYHSAMFAFWIVARDVSWIVSGV
jgi:hypothetical protein